MWWQPPSWELHPKFFKMVGHGVSYPTLSSSILSPTIASLSLSLYIYETQKLTIIKVKLFSQLDGNNFFLKIIKDKPIKYI